MTVIALAIMLIATAARSGAQSFNGRWATRERAIENDRFQKIILDLKQDGNKLSGTYQTLAFETAVTGATTGSHFKLWTSGDASHPVLTGDLVGNELKGMATWLRESFSAYKTTPADGIPLPAYIKPPALHYVSYSGLAKTPPMGWNSWNYFAERVTDQDIRDAADAMVASGMRDAGYVYVNIDGGWQGPRDAQGNIWPNHKFPDMKALADYIHSRGLKIGIYSSPGPYDCAGNLGSYGHEIQDAKQFANWGIDYVKYDWCSAAYMYKNESLQAVYQKMGDALRETGRPMIYSLCEYGWDDVEKWGAQAGGDLWRTTGDIGGTWTSMISNIENQVKAARNAGPGHWNDPDMLEIGNGHMTAVEDRTHMSLWALSAAPLIAGNDLHTMTDETKSILLNREVIAVDQDPLGKQATPVKEENLERWVKPLINGDVAVGLVNLGKSPATATVKADDLGLKGAVKSARDLWAHQYVHFENGQYSATVPAHGVLMLRVSTR